MQHTRRRRLTKWREEDDESPDFRYRVTGIATPVVGSSFDREKRERAIAQDLIDFLEDRAVLFEDDLYEDTESCRDSVFKIANG